MVRLFVRTRTHPQLSGVTVNQHHTPPVAVAIDDADGLNQMPGWGWSIGSANGPTVVDECVLIPIYCAAPFTCDQVGIPISSAVASSTIRLGLYAASLSGIHLTPGALVEDWGTVDTSTTGDKFITITNTLTQGYQFFCYSASHASISPTGPNHTNGWWAPVTGLEAGGPSGFRSCAIGAAEAGSAAELPATITGTMTIQNIQNMGAMFVREAP